ncbi:MAG TPA: hypothetical protein VLE96_02495 [Chlamydiales bacterium]|nr:hypothetical protein [Chlamydiales bacterium]
MSKISSDTQKAQLLEYALNKEAEVKGSLDFFEQQVAYNDLKYGRAMQSVGTAISVIGAKVVYEGIQNKDIIVTCVGSGVTLVGMVASLYGSLLVSSSKEDKKIIEKIGV